MNKYEIVGIVGEGAYGIVYKAKNKENGENVAIKKFKESTDEDEIVKKTTNREIRMLKTLRHENIVVLKEAFKRKGKLYLVFEFVDKTLLEILEERTQGLQPQIIKRYIFHLLKAIDYCHQMNVVHRDIKPENLLIDPQDNLKLCDFGFARNIPQTKGNQQMTDYVATRWYRSPELLLSDRYSKEVDIWAIGCIMGELSDGEPMFPGESEVDQLFEIQKILGCLTPFQQEQFAKNPRFMGFKFPDVTKPETLEKKYGTKISKEGLALMRGLLIMDPKERISAKAALMHPFFDGLRTQAEEDEIAKNREKGLKRVESSTGPRNGTMTRNDQSRSRSGLRNTKIIKGNVNPKKFNMHSDPLQDMNNKSRSLGRKTNEKNALIVNQNMPYGQISNIRDSSVSNTSNQNGSGLASYASNGGKKSNYGQGNPNGFAVMNNFVPTNMVPSNFYHQGQVQGAYNYEINLNAVNKSLNTNTGTGAENSKYNQRQNSTDYDNNPKNIYMTKNSSTAQRQGEKQNGISTGGNNVIFEMDAENNEDESYYLSQSPIRKTKSKGPAGNVLSNNPSNFVLENMNTAGNQQNQQNQNQYSPSSGSGMNMNGGKGGNNKKSNAHLSVGAGNGTIGGATHGYGPIGGGIVGSRSGNTVQNTSNNQYSAIQGHMNINVFKQNSNGGSGHISTTMKESVQIAKINNKIKKRQFNNQASNGLQQSCNTNPGRGDKHVQKEREGSVDATSSYNNGVRPGQQTSMGPNGKLTDVSEEIKKDNVYMTTQIMSGGSITGDIIDINNSPRNNKNLEKMNVMNFITKNKPREKSDGRFVEEQTESYQKVINRQGSKKMIQASHLMQHHVGAGSQFSNQFMQNKHAPFNAIASGNAGGYEYDINLPNSQTKNQIGDSVGSNQSSVVGHYNEGGQAQNRESNSQNNFGLGGNINVKKSMIKMNSDIRDRDMDMSPQSNNNKDLNFSNQNQWKNQKY